MKIEATLDDKGRLQTSRPLRLKPRCVQVTVEIPDDALADDDAETVTTDTTLARTRHAGEGDIRERIRAILGADQEKLAGTETGAEQSKAIWHRHLEDKHLDRR